MRPIDADAFELIAYTRIPDGYSDSFDDGVQYIADLIDRQPTIEDLRHVVCCRDCVRAVKTKHPFDDDILLCTSIYGPRFVRDGFYCADGEMKGVSEDA